MLICFKCHRQDGVHDVFCPYISDDEIVREFMVLNADLFESEPLTHPIGGEPRRIPIRSQGLYVKEVPCESGSIIPPDANERA